MPDVQAAKQCFLDAAEVKARLRSISRVHLLVSRACGSVQCAKTCSAHARAAHRGVESRRRPKGVREFCRRTGVQDVLRSSSSCWP